MSRFFGGFFTLGPPLPSFGMPTLKLSFWVMSDGIPALRIPQEPSNGRGRFWGPQNDATGLRGWSGFFRMIERSDPEAAC